MRRPGLGGAGIGHDRAVTLDSGQPSTVDLNADVGESFGRWELGDDAALLPHLTSANVACGFHAGDPLTLQRTRSEEHTSELQSLMRISYAVFCLKKKKKKAKKNKYNSRH